MIMKRLKVAVSSLCRTYWRSHGCYKLPGHAGPHVCECADVCGQQDRTY